MSNNKLGKFSFAGTQPKKKLIRMFMDWRIGIDLLNDAVPRVENYRRYNALPLFVANFFSSLRELESSYAADISIMFLSQASGRRSQRFFDHICELFNDVGAIDERRPPPVLDNYELGVLSDCKGEAKAKAVGNMYKQEVSEGRTKTVACIYAGYDDSDYLMAKRHGYGEYFPGVPGIFVDGNPNSPSIGFEDNEVFDLPKPYKGSYKELGKVMNIYADLRRQKNGGYGRDIIDDRGYY